MRREFTLQWKEGSRAEPLCERITRVARDALALEVCAEVHPWAPFVGPLEFELVVTSPEVERGVRLMQTEWYPEVEAHVSGGEDATSQGFALLVGSMLARDEGVALRERVGPDDSGREVDVERVLAFFAQGAGFDALLAAHVAQSMH